MPISPDGELRSMLAAVCRGPTFVVVKYDDEERVGISIQ
jgi:hypothetical protein